MRPSSRREHVNASRMSNSTPVKNGRILVVVQMISAWVVQNGYNFIVECCLVPRVRPYGRDVLVDVRFKIRRWGETGLHVDSACSFASSISSLVTRDADVTR